MTRCWRRFGFQLTIASAVLVGGVIVYKGDCAFAQIAPDGTLPNNSIVTPSGNTSLIEGGTRAGSNLFHSFEQFSIPTGGAAHFNNALDVQNIFSRVTGKFISNIDGLIRANGTANLFLLNPNGIIFGPNASLSISGSFLGSTASSINFADGTQFSATAPQTKPLLTVSVPLGLQFGNNPKNIQVQGNGQGLRSTSDLIDTTVGLRVQPDQTLAIVGGDVALEGGTLKTAGGRIELGSVAGSGLVSLTPIDKGWALGYSGVPTYPSGSLSGYGDIHLSGGAAVDASGEGGGDIQVRGKRVTLKDGSQIEASTLGAQPGGSLNVTASDLVELSGTSADGRFHSGLVTDVYEGATGSGGNLTVETGQLIRRNRSLLEASSFGQGSPGKLTVISKNFGQIIPDETLPVSSTVSLDGNTSIIEGGTQAGSNLFHSFAQFSVPTLNTAYFNNGLDIQNIIARVTGGSVSNIDGLLQANASANLFLLNPNGIIFGPDASLNIGGSFVATTANAIQLGDTGLFSASEPASSNLLTVRPSALIFNAVAAQEIINQSKTEILSGESLSGNTIPVGIVGLQVPTGKTLALVGGNVVMSEGNLTATQGRIELGSVAGVGEVSLSQSGDSWVLGYDKVDAFGNIKLEDGAWLDASGDAGGSFQIQGAQLEMTQANISADTDGTEVGGEVLIHTTEGITLSNGSSIRANVFGSGTGTGGNLTITTGKLIVRDGSTVSTLAAGEEAQGGTLTVNASESVELIAGSPGQQPGGLSVQALFDGNAGAIKIETEKLIVQDGAQVIASSFGQGNAGDIQVNATNSVNLSGVDPSGYSSGLYTTSGGGQGGNITVNTSAFRIAEGAIVDAKTTFQGNGGSITVKANTFEAVNGGQILTSTRGSGRAGNITLNVTNSVTFSGSDPTFAERLAQFSRDVVSNEGPVIISNEGTLIRLFANIAPDSTDAASGLFANTTPDSTGDGGSISIDPIKLTMMDGAGVAVGSLGQGNAGNLLVQAGEVTLDGGAFLSAAAATGKGGNIRLDLQELLLLRGNSQISATSGSLGNEGNITIDTGILAAFENSDIIANAFAEPGANIQITAQGIFGTQTREQQTLGSDITASGNVEVNTPDVDPSQGLATLPTELVEASGQITTTCAAVGENKFTITGRGGLPPNPSDPLSSDAIWVDWVTLNPKVENSSSPPVSTNPTAPESAPIVEARGWVINGKGEVMLTANAPTTTPHSPWITSATCHTPQASS